MILLNRPKGRRWDTSIGWGEKVQQENKTLINKIYGGEEDEIDFEQADEEDAMEILQVEHQKNLPHSTSVEDKYHFAEEIQEEETLSLQDKELELIKKSLERNKGKRKAAATELGISERTLYRKIKQYDL